MYSIRLFNPIDDEYAAIVAIYNAVWPDERQHSVEMWRDNDDEWPATALHQRYVAEYDGRIVGMGACWEQYWQHQPGTVHIDFHVHPDHGGGGVDELLYNIILDFLLGQTPPPKILATRAREDRLESARFLQERGFTPVMRSPKASLKVADFDVQCFQSLRGKLAAQGIDILTLSELIARDVNWKHRLYELRWAIIQDVPSVEPHTRPSFSEFENMVLEDPALDEEAWFVAVDEHLDPSLPTGSIVGMSNLWINDPAHQRLDTGLTGVLKEYRRRGIATALKVCTVEFAHQLGAQTIETANEENNPMFDINLRLGFQPKAAWVSYRKEF
jgi:GNAT superfamily N-acetyltransferase